MEAKSVLIINQCGLLGFEQRERLGELSQPGSSDDATAVR